jgi:hypothetical protein
VDGYELVWFYAPFNRRRAVMAELSYCSNPYEARPAVYDEAVWPL